MGEKKNPHWGTTLDKFLDEEGARESAKAEALTRVVSAPRGKSRLRSEIVEAMRGLHKVGAVSAAN